MDQRNLPGTSLQPLFQSLQLPQLQPRRQANQLRLPPRQNPQRHRLKNPKHPQTNRQEDVPLFRPRNHAGLHAGHTTCFQAAHSTIRKRDHVRSSQEERRTLHQGKG